MKKNDISAIRGREGFIPIHCMTFFGAQSFIAATVALNRYIALETIALIAVLGVMTVILVVMAEHAARRTVHVRAQTDLQIIRTSLEEYRLRNGEYPRNQDEFNEAVKRNALDWYEQTRNNDPWGTPYEYCRTAPLEYHLWSQGLDQLHLASGSGNLSVPWHEPNHAK